MIKISQPPIAFNSRISVWRNASQSIPTSEYTKIQFNTKVYDILGEFDNVTNYRFTAKAAGFYSVKTVVGLSFLDADKYLNVTIRVNNVVQASCDTYVPVDADKRMGVTKDVQLGVGDYVEVFVYHTSVGAQDTIPDINACFLTIHRFA